MDYWVFYLIGISIIVMFLILQALDLSRYPRGKRVMNFLYLLSPLWLLIFSFIFFFPILNNSVSNDPFSSLGVDMAYGIIIVFAVFQVVLWAYWPRPKEENKNLKYEGTMNQSDPNDSVDEPLDLSRVQRYGRAIFFRWIFFAKW